MNKNINLIISVIFIIFAVSIGYSIIVFAQELQRPEISYPVEELGNCKSETECKVFCDKPANMIPCVNFAEKNELISKDEAKKAKAFIQASMKGPGGCSNKDECEAFCNNPENIKPCISFAKENDLMSDEEIEEAEKVIKALEGGAQLPGGCANKKDCESYCDNPDNMEECIIFAEKAGFIPAEEAEMARKMMPLMKAGKMPGGCRGKEQCEVYCADDSHSEECANFAMEAGLMNPEEFEMFKKTGGKGPGGCKGKEQCETFCNNPENQESCFNFAKDHDLIPLEEIERMKQGMGQMRQMMGGEDGSMMPGIPGESGRGAGMPPEIAQCLKSTVGEEVFDKMQDGKMMPSQQVGEQMRKCFEQFMSQGGIQGEFNKEIGPERKFNREEFERMGHSQDMPIEDEEFEMEEMRAIFPERAPNQEMIQKMMQEGNFPQEFQNEFQKGGIPQQYIPEQYQGIIEQYQKYPSPMIPSQDMQIYQPQPAPIQEPIPPSSGTLNPLTNFGASILQLLMGL